MLKNIKSVTVIGYTLVLLYVTSIMSFGVVYSSTPFRNHATILAILFTGLLFGSCGVIVLREWGRRLLVILNAVVAFYFVILLFKFSEYVHISYPLMSVVIVLFFSQSRIKFQMERDWQNIRKSILVVDDDEGLLRTVKRILLPNGYSVLTATTGERGLQIAKNQKPDLILLDVILPGIKGRELCSRLKENPETREIPVAFLTAKDSPDDIDAEMAAGAISHLTKPVESKLLLEEIKKILG